MTTRPGGEIALAVLNEALEKKDALGLPPRPEVTRLDAGYGTGTCAVDVLDREVLPHARCRAARTPAVPTWKCRTFDLAKQRRRREKVPQAGTCNRVRELQMSRGYLVGRKCVASARFPRPISAMGRTGACERL